MFEQQKPIMSLAGGNPTVRLVPAEPPANYFVLLHNNIYTHTHNLKLTSVPKRFLQFSKMCFSISKNQKIEGIMTECSVVETWGDLGADFLQTLIGQSYKLTNTQWVWCATTAATQQFSPMQFSVSFNTKMQTLGGEKNRRLQLIDKNQRVACLSVH